MKRHIVLALAISPLLGGCLATTMGTAEGMLRGYAAGGGVLSRAATFAADVHKGVRQGVLGDPTVVPNDPAASAADTGRPSVNDDNKKQ